MKIIGLCGGSGSGKGTVAAIFNELGIKSIDADKVYHELISTDSECTLELVKEFGKAIHATTGINRKALRNVVFSSKENLLLLNQITHKHIIASIKRMIAEEKNAVGIIIDAPLLFESRLNEECDLTICVIADDKIRKSRIIERDGLTPDEANARISSQISNDDLIKKCTYSIENNSDTNNLKAKVYELNKLIFDN